MPSSLGGRSTVVVRQMKILQFSKFLKFDNFNSKACLVCLNGFMVLIASYQLIYDRNLQEMLL